jgi:CRISPR-associated RAMP protein (TIGR02581 family)
MFDTFKSRLELSGWLAAETAFRIGAGRSSEVIGADLPVVRDLKGQPYIPGSSFKGVLRSHLESFIRAIRDDRKWACHPVSNQEWCITHEEIEEQRRKIARQVARKQLPESQADRQLTQWIARETCLICLTFGSPWLAARVQVRDLLVDADFWFDQFQVRNGVAIDRDTETADDGKLYDFEVVPSGVRFCMMLLVENAEPWQRGMMLLGLNALRKGGIAIGGGKSRGLGRVKLVQDEGKFFDLDGDPPADKIDHLFEFLSGSEGAFKTITKEQEQLWIREFKEMLKNKAVEARA